MSNMHNLKYENRMDYPYTTLSSERLAEIASKFCNNHSSFDSFSWSTRSDLHHPEIYGIYTMSHRDSGVIDRANQAAIIDEFRARLSRQQNITWSQESHRHYAFGYTDALVVRVYKTTAKKTYTKAFLLLAAILDKLEDYPILDDDTYDKFEQDEIDDNWTSWVKRDFLAGIEPVLADYAKSDKYLEFIDNDSNVRYLFQQALDEVGGNWEVYDSETYVDKFEDIFKLADSFFVHRIEGCDFTTPNLPTFPQDTCLICGKYNYKAKQIA